MRNATSKIKLIIGTVASMPYFTLFDLSLAFEKKKAYFKTMLSRYAKKGELIRLKKGFYVTKAYIDKLERKNTLSGYAELIANILHTPSYLSLEWVLYENNILTELPKNFTSVTLKKTAVFSNKLGNFLYHKIRRGLYYGYKVEKKNDFTFFRATKAKALFDFLYLRKNFLLNEKSIRELRLNLDSLSAREWKELEGYAKTEGSKKMKDIFNNLKK